MRRTSRFMYVVKEYYMTAIFLFHREILLAFLVRGRGNGLARNVIL